MDMYIYASGDEEAISKAQEIAQKERAQWDNQAEILSVSKSRFGSLGSEVIYQK